MLEIELPLVLLTAVVFLGLIFVLNNILYKPLLKFIDARNEAIRNDEESASKNTSDLSVHEAEIEQIILAARSEAGKIKQDAMGAAKESAAKIIGEKRAVLEADYEAFMQNLQTQKDEFKADLVAKLPDLKNVLKTKLAKI
ncbi:MULTISPECIES: FoF1 ATP synthase subunit B' [unclassified Campylobacter]|uniref:FoF1 ATP synthase subunit B' n=1 Tax=unclassified Campylobacter TaxID=2593542 RepID=UPI001472DDC0|nr:MULTISPECIES: FoF1 ATP synthase subunit B' [unclassified Campylobacter]QKF92815.1 ATP synthase, F0 complex, b' subunit [Campylobacter sp. CCUG 57310]